MSLRTRLLIFAVMLVLAGVIARPSAANITGTGLTSVSPPSVSLGATLDITFNVEVVQVEATLPEQEFLRRFEITLPDAWTINSIGAAPASYTAGVCTPEPITQAVVGQTLQWYGIHADNCGPWAPGSYTFTANVTVKTCAGAPWSLPWTTTGDGFGAGPHATSGIATVAGSGCGKEVPGPDMVPIPEGSVVGMFVVDTPAYFEPRADAATTFVLQAGKTVWVYGVDATGKFYRAMLSGKLFWVPVGTMAPNPDAVWNNWPLPTQRAD